MSSSGKSGKSYLLPDQMYGDEYFSSSEDNEELEAENYLLYGDTYSKEMSKLLKSLEIWDEVDLLDNSQMIEETWPDKCEKFLSFNNIKPDFFCQYNKIVRETKALQQRRLQQNRRKRRLLTGRTHITKLFLKLEWNLKNFRTTLMILCLNWKLTTCLIFQ